MAKAKNQRVKNCLQCRSYQPIETYYRPKKGERVAKSKVRCQCVKKGSPVENIEISSTAAQRNQMCTDKGPSLFADEEFKNKEKTELGLIPALEVQTELFTDEEES